MRPMTSKFAKWLLWIGIGIALLTAVGAAGMAVVLPNYVEGHLVPRLGRDFGLSTDDIRVRRIGFWGSDLGAIRLMANHEPAVTIAAVQIDYSPLSLMRGEIKGLTLGGLEIRGTLTPDGASIGGIRLPAASNTLDKGEAAVDLRRLLPIQLGRLAIVQSHLVLKIRDRRITLPFEVELQTRQLPDGRFKGRADLSLLGNPVTLQASLDQDADTARFGLEATGFDMAALNTFFPAHLPVGLKGVLDLEGQASFGMRAFNLKALALTGRLKKAQVGTPHGNLQSVLGADSTPKPILLSVTGDRLSELKWGFAPFQITGPVVVTVDELSGGLTHSQGVWALTGQIQTNLPEQALHDRIRIPAAWSAGWQMALHHRGDQKRTDFELTKVAGGPLALQRDGLRMSSKSQTVRIAGTLGADALDAGGEVSVKTIDLVTSDGTISLPELRLDGRLGLALGDRDAPANMDGKIDMPGIYAKLDPTVARLPAATFRFTGERRPGQPWQVDGRLKLANGRLSDPSRKFRMRNLSLDLPLMWPAAKRVAPGRIKVGALEWNGRQVGSATGTLRQKDQALTMALTHHSKLFPGLRVIINGGLDRSGTATIEVKVPRHHLVEPIDIGQFQPAAAGMMVSGRLEADADLTIENGRMAGDAIFEFSQGRLEQRSRNLLLEGVDMKLHIDDMHRIQSAPQQKLTVAQVTFGNLAAQNLRVDYQLEHPGTLFVEKAQIDWSEGKINTGAVRIVPGVDDYDVLLFCDRLNLAKVLEQLGAAQAEGEGSVNGRIPIRWTNGRLSFDNGFLFSSPGQTGAIQLTGTEALLAGLPPGTPQHAQLDIATEALKDYTYKWAKLMVQTEDDILLLKLQFDGKPNRLLPFAYDQQLGQFKRVAGQGEADFRGISIDLNLRSPLNEILNYKELLK